MKKIALLFALAFLPLIIFSQEGKWEIRFNNRVIISTGTEDKAANTRIVKAREWKRSGYLEIKFLEGSPNAWKRSFILDDENDAQLWTKDSVTYLKISLMQLRQIFSGRKEINIYTIVAPANPQMAARIRRVHLCTLKIPR
jgi:hypothetical protein